MASKPILFSTEMVQAILNGRKTMTRRVAKTKACGGKEWALLGNIGDEQAKEWAERKYNIGDELWVKEAYYACGHWKKNGFSKTGKQKWKFNELTTPQCQYGEYTGMDVKTGRDESVFGWFKRPSLFMSKRHSRITLVITDIRLERLQSITNEDAKAEGASNELKMNDLKNLSELDWIIRRPFLEYQFGFLSLWCRINGKESWIENPWVWVVEFKRKEVGNA